MDGLEQLSVGRELGVGAACLVVGEQLADLVASFLQRGKLSLQGLPVEVVEPDDLVVSV